MVLDLLEALPLLWRTPLLSSSDSDQLGLSLAHLDALLMLY
jgi:hypothetical protein